MQTKPQAEQFMIHTAPSDEVRRRHSEAKIPTVTKRRSDSQATIPVCCSKAAMGRLSEQQPV